VTVVALVPSAGPAADDRGRAGSQGFVDDLWTYEVDVAVDCAGGEYPTLAGQHLGRRADDELGMHAVGDVRITRLADREVPGIRCRTQRTVRTTVVFCLLLPSL
jgi:hypothetical protein